MSAKEPNLQDFEQLLSRHFDGELSREESDELVARLKADPACARQFARASLLHDQLRTVFLSNLARESMAADAASGNPGSTASPKARMTQAGKIVAAVAVLAIGVLVSVNLTLRSTVATAPPLAVLNAEIATQWSDPNVELLLRRGDLPSGPLRLESGVAEFAFAGGATAVIEGPAVIEPLTRDRLSVSSGRVIGRCSTEQARLTIVTPSAEVTDLGTEFGVAVGDDRHTQVAVIQGEVEFVAADQSRRMKAGEAVAVDARGRAEQAAYVIQDFSKLARLMPGFTEPELAGANLLADPEITQTPAFYASTERSSPWRGTAGHVDLVSGQAHSGSVAVRIRALGNPMWPLVWQDVKTGPIAGQVAVASVWAMQPSQDPLTARQNAIVKIMFLDAAGREFASAERHFLRAEAPKYRWVRGQIAALAPPGTMALRFQVLLNARGQKSGSLLVNDAVLSITKPQEPGASEMK